MNYLDQPMQYAGFRKRFSAQFIDSFCMLPLIGLAYWIGQQYKSFALIEPVLTLSIGIWFNIYLVKRYGGTPGKVLLGLQIVRVDGRPVDYRRAALRYSVSFVLGVAIAVALVIGTMNIADADYYTLGFLERTEKINQLAPAWYGFVILLSNIWTWGETIIMLTNKRRRAPHDFMAGTVVIYAP